MCLKTKIYRYSIYSKIGYTKYRNLDVFILFCCKVVLQVTKLI